MRETERNWLIRTSQNQILGPVAKTKVIEFIQKGALGLTDEVTSGNGYWFHLREKDLVEKYIFGDVPQSYNPISEARTVLARKSNPDMTASINSSPANITQVINLKDFNLASQVVPDKLNLEYPDMSTPHLVENQIPSKNDEVKLPSNDDLDFPEMLTTQQSANQNFSPFVFQIKDTQHNVDEHKAKLPEPISSIPIDENIKVPQNADLEYPDMDFISSVKKNVESEVAKISEDLLEAEHLKKLNAEALKIEKERTDSKLKIEISDNANEKLETETLQLSLDHSIVKPAPEVKKETPLLKNKENLKEPAKLLNERKNRASQKTVNPKEIDKLPPNTNREISPELRNRNDSYLFIILIVLVLIFIVAVFYYYRVILNKPLPV